MRTKLAVAVLAAGLLYVLWPSGDSKPAALDGGDPSLLADRVWLEAMPTSPTQHVHVFLALADAPLGVFQRASAYQSTLEVFEYVGEGSRLDLRFPQQDRKAELRYRATPCTDHPPFDLCLELASNPWGGPTRYYGFSDERSAPPAIEALHHRLEHAAVERR